VPASAAGDVSNYNTSKSYAAYLQLEGHITPQFDIVGGYRLTKDDKSGYLNVSGLRLAFTYQNTRPSYLVGLNYRPIDDVLLYAKYSTGFVSGGSVAGLAFEPETASSWEVGAKSEFLDRRLRANLALFDVSYKDIQAASIGLFAANINPLFALVPAVVIDQGDSHAKGFELDLTALPLRGLTLNGAVGYTNFKYTRVNPIYGTLDNFFPSYRPDWTANLSAQYETEPLFDDVRLVVRGDASYRGEELLGNYPTLNPAFGSLQTAPAQWLLNTRVSLEHLQFGPTNVDVSLWAQNLLDDRSRTYGLFIGFNPEEPAVNTLGQATYQAARTFGIDVSFTY
jgi:iron complex outermembrane receptor protein